MHGVQKLANKLSVNRQAIQKWIRQTAVPGRTHARQIVKLSIAEPHEIGPLTLEDVL